MRLIDADALKETLIAERDSIPLTKTERCGFGVGFPDPHGMSMRGGINKAFRCMEQTPTIDAVPVVRCKDCIVSYCHSDGDFVCGRGGVNVDQDDFCSYGERRSE